MCTDETWVGIIVIYFYKSMIYPLILYLHGLLPMLEVAKIDIFQLIGINGPGDSIPSP